MGHLDHLNLSIGLLSLSINAGETGLLFSLPESYQDFLSPITPGRYQSASDAPILALTLIDHQLPKDQFVEKLCQVEIWEIWRDASGRFIFYQPRQAPPRWLVVDRDFKVGEVWGKFSSEIQTAFYPLQYIDIILYANWLAKFEDLILHAAGVAIDGKGYAFIGASGRGKSTLVANLPRQPNLTILGDDQVILRYLDGQFYIFGTPWHLNPNCCSPQGVPLEKIFFLNRTSQQATAPLKPISGMTQILQTAFIPYYRVDKVEGILNRLAALAEKTPQLALSYQLGTDILPLILGA